MDSRYATSVPRASIAVRQWENAASSQSIVLRSCTRMASGAVAQLDRASDGESPTEVAGSNPACAHQLHSVQHRPERTYTPPSLAPSLQISSAFLTYSRQHIRVYRCPVAGCARGTPYLASAVGSGRNPAYVIDIHRCYICGNDYYAMVRRSMISSSTAWYAAGQASGHRRTPRRGASRQGWLPPTTGLKTPPGVG